MLFNSSEFALFFVGMYTLYWVLRRRYRAQNMLLLAGSMLFYGWWDVRFLFLFLLTTIVDYFCALMIGRGRVPARQRLIASAALAGGAFLCVTVQWNAVVLSRQGLSPKLAVDWRGLLAGGGVGWGVFLAATALVLAISVCYPWFTRWPEARRRKAFLVGSIVSNLSVLGFFKYFNFFAQSFAELAHVLFGVAPSAWTLNIILPVGISFYTFQSLAYTIDVYRGLVQPVERYATLAAFLSFFPQLVAGPISRPNQLLPQFLRPRVLTREHFREGLWLIAWGLFKKMVVADNMALIVSAVFRPYDGTHPSSVVPEDGLRLLIGIYAFAFQIYGDFSGYTDIARGVSRLLGFELILNFNLPYFAVSPSDFWQRWHISLSSWLRDYLYIPLGGNRGGLVKTQRNLLITMLLGGLWHGANWTFVLWGAYHGLLLAVYRLVAPNLTQRRKTTLGATQQVDRVACGRTAVTTYAMLVPLGGADRLMGPRRWAIVTYTISILIMFHLTCLGWLLFRAQNLQTVGVFVTGIFLHPHWSSEAAELLRNLAFYGWFLVAFQLIQWIMGTLNPLKNLHWFVRLNVWLFVVMSILALSAQEKQAFIYFAF